MDTLPITDHHAFCRAPGKLSVFDEERAKVDRGSTSELSPWVHIGSVSMRYIFYRVRGLCLRHRVNPVRVRIPAPQ